MLWVVGCGSHNNRQQLRITHEKSSSPCKDELLMFRLPARPKAGTERKMPAGRFTCSGTLS